MKNNIKRNFNNLIINILLLISGLAMIFSGLVMQVGFHMGDHDGQQIEAQSVLSQTTPYEQLRAIDTTKIVCGFNYTDWLVIHKFVIVFITLLMIYHVFVHWNWYKGVITKHLMGKHKLVIILTLLFLLVAVTGLVPWFIDLLDGSSVLRMLFIEIHDKATLILIVFLTLHIIKKLKWYIAAFEKLK